VVGDSGQVHVARAMFDHDQRVDTSQDDSVDVQEVHGKNAFVLLAEEL
jgi:hypothetical protein